MQCIHFCFEWERRFLVNSEQKAMFSWANGKKFQYCLLIKLHISLRYVVKKLPNF
jgi:hypothetical protein